MMSVNLEILPKWSWQVYILLYISGSCKLIPANFGMNFKMFADCTCGAN